MITRKPIAVFFTFIIAFSSICFSNEFFNSSLLNANAALTHIENCQNDFVYIDNGKTIDIINYIGDKTNIIVPAMINNKAVTKISGHGGAWTGAFVSADIDEITIPACVTEIDEIAFVVTPKDIDKRSDMTIKCYSGSYAEEYAKKLGFNYSIIPHTSHHFSQTYISPTFTKDGYNIKQCDECGKWSITYKNKLTLNSVKTFKADRSYQNAVSLKWESINKAWDISSHADGYILYRYDNKTSKYKRIAKVKGTSYTDKGLIAGTTYKYAIRAYVMEDGKEALSPKYPQVVTSTNPAAVKLNVTSSKNKAALKWNKIAGAKGYQVYYKVSNNSKWQKLGSTKNTSFTKTGLKKGASYSFAVRAYKTVEKSNYFGAFTIKKIIIK